MSSGLRTSSSSVSPPTAACGVRVGVHLAVPQDPVDEHRVGELGEDVIEGEPRLIQRLGQVPGFLRILEPEFVTDEQRWHDHQRAAAVKRVEPVLQDSVVCGEPVDPLQDVDAVTADGAPRHRRGDLRRPRSPGTAPWAARQGARSPTSGCTTRVPTPAVG